MLPLRCVGRYSRFLFMFYSSCLLLGALKFSPVFSQQLLILISASWTEALWSPPAEPSMLLDPQVTEAGGANQPLADPHQRGKTCLKLFLWNVHVKLWDAEGGWDQNFEKVRAEVAATCGSANHICLLELKALKCFTIAALFISASESQGS